MALGRIAFPLRHGRPYGAASSSFTFLLAGVEFYGLLYGGAAIPSVSLPAIPFELALPAAYVVAAAAAGAMFFATRGRSAEITRIGLTELRDLEEARQRVLAEIRASEERRRPASKTRQTLDQYGPSGRAGSRRG